MGQTVATQEKVTIRKAEAKIEVNGVNKVFAINRNGNSANGKQDLVALKEIDLAVERGEFLSVVGPSGCGKSTLLDIIAGLASPSSGSVYIDGRKIEGPALDRGIVFQGYALFPWRTVRGNIEFGLEIKNGASKKERSEIAQHYISLVGLDGFEDRYPHELSGGMKQRVAIARSLAYEPDVLLMDEPFAAVDAQTREILQAELLRIWEETRKTIIFVTHSIEEAVFLSDRVAIMTARPGKIKTAIDVPLPRPRENNDIRASCEFNQVRHAVWELLKEEVQRSSEPALQPEAAA